MRVIGLLGGMSWESTAVYYQIINRAVQERRGGQRSARILLYSVDFEEVAAAQHAARWDLAAEILADGARRLERGGADVGLLCTNTMHKLFDGLTATVELPFLHIADCTGARLRAAGHRRVALLGTRFTMEQGFYRDRLEAFGLEVLVPAEAERQRVHEVIYDELCRGRIREGSRQEYVRIVAGLEREGAEAVIFGCTEIGLLLREGDLALPVFDTARIHAEAGVEHALAE